LQQRADESEIVRFGPFRLIASERLLAKGSEPVTLGGRALDILIALIERAGEVVSHKELVKRVWSDVIVEESSLRVHIAGLRRALGDGRDGARYITNVAGRGYCFVASVQRSAPNGVRTVAGRSRIETLPARLQRMIGRDDIVEALRSEIISRRFVSIVGPGGVGKTTVAVAAAHGLVTDFPDSICFLDLSALRNDALVVPAVASAIGCLEQTQDSLLRLLAFLSDKHMLLVLDSCEHVVEAVAMLTERMFRETPHVHILATTREALRVEGENIHPLKSLDIPSANSGLTAAAVLKFPAAQLFMDRAAAGGHEHDLTDEDAPIVADICRQLDGMPLAIELTASRSSTYGIGGLAELIGDRLMLFWQGRRSVPRHHTLQALLDWSYDLLSEREKAALCALSTFTGAFTLEMAQAVLLPRDCGGYQVANVIAELVEKSLIVVSNAEGESSYRLLDTTRTYAAAKSQERGEANATARRHALYYAERLVGVPTNVLRNRDLTSYSRYVGDIGVALEWSFSEGGDHSVAVPLGAGAAPLFFGLSMLSECRRWCLQTIESLSEEERGTRLELGLLLTLATSSNHLYGNSAEVITALECGLALADSLGDAEYQMEFLAGLNLYRARLADFGGSLAAAERYTLIAREFGGPRETVMAEWMLGASHHLVGNQASAQQSYQSAFRRAATAGFSEAHSFGYDHQVRALIGYARTLWLCGFSDQAAQFAHQGIEVAGRQKHPVSLCVGLTYAAPVFLWRGDLKMAEDLIERLIAHATKYSLALYRVGGLGLRGHLLLARGETERAAEILREVLSTMRTALSTSFSRALAEALARTGRPAEATLIMKALVEDAARGSGTFELPDFLRAQAEVLLAASQDNWQRAEALFTSSIDLARQQSALGWELRAAMALGSLRADHKRADEARTLLSDVYDRFTEGFGTADLKEAERQLHALRVRTSRS
jgi:predicted ATPase